MYAATLTLLRGTKLFRASLVFFILNTCLTLRRIYESYSPSLSFSPFSLLAVCWFNLVIGN